LIFICVTTTAEDEWLLSQEEPELSEKNGWLVRVSFASEKAEKPLDYMHSSKEAGIEYRGAMVADRDR
jgi:hypothetical protein